MRWNLWSMRPIPTVNNLHVAKFVGFVTTKYAVCLLCLGNGTVEFNEFLKMMKRYYSRINPSYSEEDDMWETFKVSEIINVTSEMKHIRCNVVAIWFIVAIQHPVICFIILSLENLMMSRNPNLGLIWRKACDVLIIGDTDQRGLSVKDSV